MRRWVCVIALLFGFAGDGYAWAVRPRIAAPIERPFHLFGERGTTSPTADWWHAS